MAVTVEAVANVKIASDDVVAAQRRRALPRHDRPSKIKDVIFQTLEGHLRAILGTLTVEEINADRQAFAQKMTDEAAVDLKKMGVNIDILTIQQISDEQGYLDALGKKRTAEVKRDAVIGEAQAQRDAMIKSALADQEGKTKRYEADVAIAQSLRDKETKQAEFNAAVQAKTAESAQAGPLATAIAETARDRTGNAHRPGAQAAGSARAGAGGRRGARRSCRRRSSSRPRPSGRPRSCAPRARSRRPSSAPRRRRKSSSSKAPARRRRSSASAGPKRPRCSRSARRKPRSSRRSCSPRPRACSSKAEAWKNFNEAAVINMVVDKMPELAQAFATQLAGIDKINIIEMGNGSGGSGGVGKVMGTVGGGMTAMLAMLKDQFGVDIARLMQAKTDAAAAEAEKRTAPDQPPA